MNNATCCVTDCDRPVRYKNTGWCNPHYVRWQRHGDVQAHIPLNNHRMKDREDGTRMCRRCDEWKTLENFAVNTRCVGGRLGICKPCQVGDYRKRYEDNQERLIQIRKDTYQNNKAKRIEEATLSVHKRRALIQERTVDEGITIASLRQRDGDNCCYCATPLLFKAGTRGSIQPNRASLEHILPLSRGGHHSWDNVALACHRCNMQKNAKTVDERSYGDVENGNLQVEEPKTGSAA
jgi:5-methylcytosine-specific restriction endonuclease McrA